MLGTTIKDFKLVERLGKGGWGEVWAGEQQLVKTRVAIKLLDSEVSRHQASVERFFNEARAVGKIPHAGIVKIFDVGFYNEQAFLIMELLAGETLAGRIRRVTRMSLEDMLEISRQIAGVLAATHESGIVHRDLKPDNVFLIPDAELPSRERVKILDFGIAKLAGSSTTTTEAGSMGTPAYMAPEQWRDAGSAEAPSDVYSLGCVMFEMCCGRPPFIANSTAEACTQHLEVAPPRAKSIAPGLPSALDELIDRMLAKRPADRPMLVEISRTLENARPSSDTLLAPARPAAVVPTTVTSLVGAVMPKPTPTKSRRMLAIGVLGVAIAAGAGTTVYVRSQSSTATPPSLGLKAIEDYTDPRPDTVNNRRSDALWSAAQDDFSRACGEPGADARWCAGERFATGQLALIRDDVPAAVSAFRAATLIDPGWTIAYVALSYALAFAHDRDGALAAARRAQSLDPTGWQAAAASARAYVSAGPVEDSLIEYKRALSLSPPNNAVLLSEVALAYHFAVKDAEATRLAAQADALDHTLAGVHLIRAERALEVNDAQVALAEADQVLAVSPKNGAGLIARGDALALMGDRSGAMAVYKRALALRGGLNILSISEIRLAKIERALAIGELPPPRHPIDVDGGEDVRTGNDSQPAVHERSRRPQSRSSDSAGEQRSKIVDGDSGGATERSRSGEDHSKAPLAQQSVKANLGRKAGSTTVKTKTKNDPKAERSPATPDQSIE